MYIYKMNVKLDMNMLNCVLLVVVLVLVIMCCMKTNNESFVSDCYGNTNIRDARFCKNLTKEDCIKGDLASDIQTHCPQFCQGCDSVSNTLAPQCKDLLKKRECNISSDCKWSSKNNRCRKILYKDAFNRDWIQFKKNNNFFVKDTMQNIEERNRIEQQTDILFKTLQNYKDEKKNASYICNYMYSRRSNIPGQTFMIPDRWQGTYYNNKKECNLDKNCKWSSKRNECKSKSIS
jgi:hypothetical protein